MGKRKAREREPVSGSDQEREPVSGSDQEQEREPVSGSDQEQDQEQEQEQEQESSVSFAGSDDEKELDIAQKRLRLAKEYLAILGQTKRKKPTNDSDSEPEGADAAEMDRELIAARLKRDALTARGRNFCTLANDIWARQTAEKELAPATTTILTHRAHNQTATCLAVGQDSSGKTVLVSGSKGGDVVVWEGETGKRIRSFKPIPRKKGTGRPTKGQHGHKGHVLCVAISGDARMVASGGVDKTIHLWEIKSGKHLACFTQHRAAVTGLVFQRNSHQLYSCSADRTIKLWATDQPAYIDTLFGHQDELTAIDALAQEQCLSVGGRDRTARLWKISDESQLIFRASDNAGSVLTTVALLDNEHFVTGSDQGALSLWSTGRKKPTSVLLNAHAHEIISLASTKFSDLFASASDDALVKIWRVEPGFGKMTLLREIPLAGSVNGLAFTDDGRTLFAIVGRDHRLGRWRVDKTVRNALVRITVSL